MFLNGISFNLDFKTKIFNFNFEIWLKNSLENDELLIFGIFRHKNKYI